MHQTLVLFTVLTLSWAQTPFQDCGSSGVSIVSVNVPGCTDFPCQLKRGHNASLNITFIAKREFKALKNEVYGIFSGTPLPFYKPSTTVCDGCGVKCPIMAGSNNTDHFSVAVQSYYPTISIKARIQLVDSDTGVMQGCFEVGVKII